MKIRVLAVLAAVAVAGCANFKDLQPLHPVARSAPPKDVDRPLAPLEPMMPVQIIRAFAGPDTPLFPMPTGVIVLNVAESARNRKICDAYLALQTESSLHASDVLPGASIVTRMPLTRAQHNAQNLIDCDYLLTHYDYGRASALMDDLGLAISTGPVFVGLLPTAAAGSPTPSAIAVDGSSVTLDELPTLLYAWHQAAAMAVSDAPAARQGGRVTQDGLRPVAEPPPQEAALDASTRSGGKPCTDYEPSLRAAGRFVAALAALLFETIPHANVLVKASEAMNTSAEEAAVSWQKLAGDALGTAIVSGCNRLFSRRGDITTPRRSG